MTRLTTKTAILKHLRTKGVTVSAYALVFDGHMKVNRGDIIALVMGWPEGTFTLALGITEHARIEYAR